MFDTLIHNGMIVTVDDALAVLPGGAVAIRDGGIARVWTPASGEALPQARETIDAGGALVMPGLVNAHTHLPMSLFRGLADDLALTQWLQERILPAEQAHITPASVALGAQLSCAEMVLGGTTTCCDGYFLVDHFAAAVARVGMRAVLGQGVIDFPAPGVPDPTRNVTTAREVVTRWQSGTPLVQPAIFCHAPYTCSARTLQTGKAAADELGVLFQIHVAETRQERDDMLRQHGQTPIAYLERLGLLDGRTLLVHAVWADATDVAIVARTGARVVHCPQSNMKLAGGVAPVPDYLAAGVAVALGTDGCASNNDLSMWGEMDSAAKLHKVHRADPTVMDATTVVRMATLQGARALGLDHLVGSLTPGKRADLIILKTAQPHLTPLYHAASHLVYAARAADVNHVMVDGRWIVRDRRLLTVDPDDLMDRVNRFARKIATAPSA